MIWNSHQIDDEKLGYQIAFRTRCSDEGVCMPDLTPPQGHGWVLVGSSDHQAGIWVKPLASEKVKLNSSLVRKLMAECDPFVETIGGIDSDFFQEASSSPILVTFGSVLKHAK